MKTKVVNGATYATVNRPEDYRSICELCDGRIECDEPDKEKRITCPAETFAKFTHPVMERNKTASLSFSEIKRRDFGMAENTQKELYEPEEVNNEKDERTVNDDYYTLDEIASIAALNKVSIEVRKTKDEETISIYPWV